jgi:hypothetical protein
MKPGGRLALRLVLVAWLALVLSAGFGSVPSMIGSLEVKVFYPA